jgi:predicted transcriptional regulator
MEPEKTQNLLVLTTEIVSAYAGHHHLAVHELTEVVRLVGQSLATAEQSAATPPAPEPAVSVRRSVRPDHLICLVCGRKVKMLRRHLQAAHGLSPADYRSMFALKPDYPMSAPALTEQRAAVAQRIGLGRRKGARAAPARKAAAAKAAPARKVAAPKAAAKPVAARKTAAAAKAPAKKPAARAKTAKPAAAAKKPAGRARKG